MRHWFIVLWIDFRRRIKENDMPKLFDGDWRDIYNKAVYYKGKAEFIPCLMTNYYFKHKKYTLVPLWDIANIENHGDRRVFLANKVYIG